MDVPAQTVRFTAVVEKCGKPEAVTLWGKPDESFMNAARQKRVMTVTIQTVGTKAEFGIVGFHPTKNVSYLVFSKPLTEFEGKRVVGIKYDLLEGGRAMGEATPPPKRVKEKIAKPPPPPSRHFRVTMRLTATVDVTKEIEAENRLRAKQKAEEMARQEAIDLSNAAVARKIIKIAEVSRTPE
jgi:hypothetical protein